MDDLDLFSDPAEVAPARRERPKRVRVPHRCTACGRRTYRRVRRLKTLGKVDARCQVCADRGHEPQVST